MAHPPCCVATRQGMPLRGECAQTARHGKHGHETAAVVLADLEHVLRLPGDPVRLRAAERERQPDLPDPGCGHGAGAGVVDRRAADGTSGAARDRPFLRPHLDAAREAPALLPVGRDLLHTGAAGDAQLAAAVDRGRHAVAARCLAQRVHGAFPCLRR